MDFLRRHVEKLILGLALLALLASVALLLRSLSNTRAAAVGVVDQARMATTGGKTIDVLDPESFGQLYDILADPRVKIDTTPAESASPLRGSLYEPPTYIICYNEACNRLIPIGQDKCPFCGTEQPSRHDSDPKSQVTDRDGDGIPNHVEQKYPFLNPDNPLDALQDQDQDGFLNVEEFKTKTDMQNAAVIPPLGYLVRLDKLVQKPLPIMLKRISRNNSDDPAAWTITMQTYDAAKKTWRSRLAAVGKTVDGFVIRSASFEEDPQKKDKQSGTVAVAPEAGGDPYTLREGVPANERDKFARLYYLASRQVQNARRGGVRILIHKPGDTFTLSRGREPNAINETYRLESVTENAAEIVRTDPPPAPGQDALRIKVPLFNSRTDFIPQATATGAAGPGMEGVGPMPGMEGDPAMMGMPPGGGMMPAMPPAPRR